MRVAVTGDVQHRLGDVHSNDAATRVFAGKQKRDVASAASEINANRRLVRGKQRNKSALPCRVASERKYSSDEIVPGCDLGKIPFRIVSFLLGIIEMVADFQNETTGHWISIFKGSAKGPGTRLYPNKNNAPKEFASPPPDCGFWNGCIPGLE